MHRLLGLATLTVGVLGCKDAPKAKHDAPPGDGAPTIDARPLPDAAVATCTPQAGRTVALEPYVTAGLTEPLLLTAAPGDPRHFVIEQDGRVRVIDGGQLVAAPFLDILDRVNADGSEQGLLGMALHPDFRNNDRFYLHYTGQNGDHVISEFTAMPGTNAADPASEREVLRFSDPYSNHNGGSIEFGPDGMLYIAIGDGGSGGDPGDRAQSDLSLFGKILRIDVDTRTGDKQYGIPADNPFAASPDGAADPRPEIWHKGLRNPFRFSFDRQTGDIYIGDVGQGPNPVNLEEIDVAPNQPGINWGWDDREGNRCFEPATNCLTAGRREPVVVKSGNDGWRSIMGGQVYRGTCFPDLVGTYFYSDYAARELWAFEWDGANANGNRRAVPGSVGNVVAIHEDAVGELYVVDRGGTISRITAAP